MKKIALIFTVILSALTACNDPNEGELFVTPPETEAEMSVTDILESQPETYSMWIELLKHADLYNALKNTDRATVFCPDNNAVRSFLAGENAATVAELDKGYARAVAQIHI